MSQRRGLKEQVTGPLLIAAILAAVALVATLIFATGGTNNQANLMLALSIAGGVFVVTLVMCATLIIVERPNDEHLGEGTGINRSSAKLYAEAKARREAEAKRNAAARIDKKNQG